MKNTTEDYRMIAHVARLLIMGKTPTADDLKQLGRIVMNQEPGWAWDAAELHFGSGVPIAEIAAELHRKRSTVHDAVNRCLAIVSDLNATPDHWKRWPAGRRPKAKLHGTDAVLHRAGLIGQRHNRITMIREKPDEEPDI